MAVVTGVRLKLGRVEDVPESMKDVPGHIYAVESSLFTVGFGDPGNWLYPYHYLAACPNCGRLYVLQTKDLKIPPESLGHGIPPMDSCEVVESLSSNRPIPFLYCCGWQGFLKDGEWIFSSRGELVGV